MIPLKIPRMPTVKIIAMINKIMVVKEFPRLIDSLNTKDAKRNAIAIIPDKRVFIIKAVVVCPSIVVSFLLELSAINFETIQGKVIIVNGIKRFIKLTDTPQIP